MRSYAPRHWDARLRLGMMTVVATAVVTVMLAAAPSGGMRVAGTQVAPVQDAHALQIQADTRNRRVWLKTSTSEIARRGALRIAVLGCARALAIPYIGILVAGSCTALANHRLTKLARRYPGRGIWLEIGRCSSGKRGVCGDFF